MVCRRLQPKGHGTAKDAEAGRGQHPWHSAAMVPAEQPRLARERQQLHQLPLAHALDPKDQALQSIAEAMRTGTRFARKLYMKLGHRVIEERLLLQFSSFVPMCLRSSSLDPADDTW